MGPGQEKARLFNLIGKRKIARETSATLNATKVLIERGVSPLRLEVVSKHAHGLAQSASACSSLRLSAPSPSSLTLSTSKTHAAGRDRAAIGVVGVTIVELFAVKITRIAP